MKENIRKYARLGLVHHMLHPDSIENPGAHVETLIALSERTDIETFDCCLPYDKNHRETLARALPPCGKEIVSSPHLSIIKGMSPSSTVSSEQGLVRVVYADQADAAAGVGASGFVCYSGRETPGADIASSRAAFADFSRWLCGRLAGGGITALLEPFDTDIDKKFVYGATADCAALIDSFRPEVTNFGINLDFAHIPLMHETFSQAVGAVRPHLKRVHLGNCVMRDKSSPWYGDMHPPIGIDGGEIDTPQLARQLALLLEAGYLDTASRGALVLEMRPFPGMTAEETVEDAFRRLDTAWGMV